MIMTLKSRILLILFVLCLSVFLVLLIFSRKPYDSDKGVSWFYESNGQPTYSHVLKILSIDAHDGKVKMEYSAEFPPGREVIFLNVDFGNDEWDLAHSESGFVWGGKMLSLIEQKKKTQDIYLDGHERSTYKTEFEISIPINQKRFPFDAVNFEFWIYRGFPESLSAKIDSSKFIKAPWLLHVYSYIDGYVLTKGVKKIVNYNDAEFQDAEVVKFSLKRDIFIRIMTILFFLSGLAISLYIALTWRLEKLADLSLLTFFAALWGVRNILLDPIPKPKPFPTLIDTFVLYMIFIVPILFVWVRKLNLQSPLGRVSDKPKDTKL